MNMYLLYFRMASGSMLKYIQTNNSELNSIVEDEDEPREVSEQ